MTDNLSPQMREQIDEFLNENIYCKEIPAHARIQIDGFLNSLTAKDEGKCECPICVALRLADAFGITLSEDEPKCCGCGKLYEQFGLDTVLPNGQWELLHAKEESLLCANCIVDRASEIKGCTVAHMILEIAPPTGGMNE